MELWAGKGLGLDDTMAALFSGKWRFRRTMLAIATIVSVLAVAALLTAYWKGYFLLSWKNTKSRVYEIAPKTMQILRTFDMPDGAVHTSGLAWDGKYLWAVDYISNRAYCMDLGPSFANKHVKIVGSFDTELESTSGCCMVEMDGGRYLAIPDFMQTRETVFVRPDDAMASGTADGAIDFRYQNEGFSQGLEFAIGFLWESENRLGINVVNKIDIEKLRRARNARGATVAQYNSPATGVEDLAWDGKYMWTSDERVFKFFRTGLTPSLTPERSQR